MPGSPIQLDNLKVYKPFAGATLPISYLNAMKNFILTLKYFNTLSDSFDISEYTMTVNIEALELSDIGLKFSINSRMVTIDYLLHDGSAQRLLYSDENTTNDNCQIFTFATTLSSGFWLYSPNNITGSTNLGNVIIMIVKAKLVGTNTYENVMIIANKAIAILCNKNTTYENIVSNINYGWCASDNCVISKFSYGNYEFDELYIIQCGTETDEVIQIGDDIYLRISYNLFIKMN
jgi:hypothetical protein